MKLDVINKSGAWFNYKDVRLGQGRDNAKEYLSNNQEIRDEIEGLVRENIGKVMAEKRVSRRSAGEKSLPKNADIDIEVDEEDAK